MPGTAEMTVQSLESDIGEIEFHTLWLEGEDAYYAVLYLDNADSERDDETRLNDVVGGMVANTGGSLESEVSIALDGYPGREVRIAIGNGEAMIRARVYVVRNRFYQLLAATMTENAESSDVDKFLDSFALTNN